MSLQDSLATLQAKLVGVTDIGSVMKFDCGADGCVVIDGKANPVTASLGDRADADLVITLSADVFQEIMAGKVNPGIAFVMGKIKIKGDKSPLLKLQKIL
jgi:putative sterol carrier protein